MSKSATVIVPTTKDRGPLLPYSVGSILNQTVEDIEIFIIGDGVFEETRKIIHELMDKDDRIKFFDHPKHKSRGEPYRHDALQQARGDIVCYLCDRDLMLDFHIESLLEHYKNYNLVVPQCFSSQIDGSLTIGYFRFEGELNDNEKKFGSRPVVPGKARGFRLSTLTHSLDLYKKLTFGWRTTPSGYPTDHYMYEQLLENELCRPYFPSHPPSVIFIRRGTHNRGWSSEKRVKELVAWFNFIKKENYLRELEILSLKGIYKERNQLVKELENMKMKVINFNAFLFYIRKLSPQNILRAIKLLYFR